MAHTKGMAKSSTRSLWKGAITFGLVHVPIGLYSATEETDVDFDWLDKRTMERINKGEKVYALLREALRETGKAGIAKVVIHSKQHLALVVPMGEVLVLNLLRWGGEVRSWEGLALPPEGKGTLKPAEMKMARQLIEGTSGRWSADAYRDSFHDAIARLVEAKAKAGKTKTVEPLEEAPRGPGAEVIDLTELLRRSLKGKKAGARPAPARKRAAAKKAPAAKARTRRAA